MLCCMLRALKIQLGLEERQFIYIYAVIPALDFKKYYIKAYAKILLPMRQYWVLKCENS